VTNSTNLFGNFASAFTGMANARLLDVAKDGTSNVDDLARTFAGITGFELVTRLGGRAFAVGAGILDVEADFGLGAKYSLLEANLDPCFDIATAALLTGTLLPGAATKEVFEDVTQAQVAKIKIDVLATETAAKRITATARCPTDAGVAELIVTLALRRVLQDFIGFVDFLKLGFITTLFVGMMLDGRAAKCFLNFVRAGTFADA
jgi:hypothetical protein